MKLIKISALGLVLILLSSFYTHAQNVQLILTQEQTSFDSLILKLYAKRIAGTDTFFGPSNFVVQIDTGILDLSSKKIIEFGPWHGTGPDDLYLPMQIGGSVSTFFNVTVNKNPNNNSVVGVDRKSVV